ncbi:MAG: asparagine synthase (glutamine-hydrolyzing) [Candidatus Omnitrophota bacterium]|nr:asparagine synthase (glutamine-hydrolyzing) [Candidatus Omnitrophota bacterium]
MCGIVGAFNLNNRPVDHASIEKMGRVLSHRGPDDEGSFFDGNIGLAHRRLSIIDLSSDGHQPMHNEDNTLCIVHNGEIYNYLELMAELKSLGHLFRSHSDTEVIIHAYEEWGAGCPGKFNGMWSFAIWDRGCKTLFCSRDRFGVKPFYYFMDKDKFVFASEIKAVLEYDGVPKAPDNDAIYRYLAKGYGYMDTDENTFFSRIKQLKSGHCLSVSADNFECRRYWNIDFENKDHAIDFGRAKEKFSFLLDDSVKLRLRSDVPVGISLSGGIDSSSLAVVMSGMLDKKIESFSACFDMEGFDERSYINETLKDKKIVPNFVFPEAKSLMSEFEKMVWHQDEPYSGASVYSQWRVMEEAHKKGIKVLLTGQGGDETLGGYYKYYPYYLADLFASFRWPYFSMELKTLSSVAGYSLSSAFFSTMKVMGSKWCPAWIKEGINGGFDRRPLFLDRDFPGADPVNKKDRRRAGFGSFTDTELYNSLVVSPLPSLLHIDDRNSMAHSVESRTPFLDYRLVEFLFSLPYDMKISNGYTKYILRETLKGRLPESIRTRRDKMGFVTPTGVWFRRELKDDILEIFNSSDFKKRGIFDKKGVDEALYAHFSGKRDLSFTIWSWINLELWFRRFFN